MKNLTQTFSVILISLLLFNGCQKEELVEIQSDPDQFIISDGEIVLGDKINDPYSINNMREAYSNLKSAGVDSPVEEIQPNKKYIRFLPKDETEWDLLKRDTSIILYDFPLDYEIEVNGMYYHDPDLPDSSITWQYCVVPIEKELPNIQHELIYEVFIPSYEDYEVDSTLKSSSNNIDFYEKLAYESFKITGNIKESEGELKSTDGWNPFKPKRWNPSGTIEVYDDVVNRLIPLEGAEVHARWSTHIEKDNTDANGKFGMGGFIYEVNYAIKWQRGEYDIRDGNITQAWFNGPKKKGSWDLDIWSGKSIMYATIHRAAFKHFYGNNLGIRRPSLSDGSKTKICYIDKYGTGVFWGDWSAGGILPDIRIWGKDANNNYRNTNVIFGTTCHELGHQAHSQYIGNINFWQTDKIIYESWADAVEWVFSNDEYHKLGNKYSVNKAINYWHDGNNHSTWPKYCNDKAYSPIFIDLMDDKNQRSMYGSDYPNDKIQVYTLSYIQNNILRYCKNIGDLKREVKNHKISGVTDSDIDELFSLY